MPGVTGEQYELVESGGVPDAGDDVIAVRNEVAARTGSELVALTYQRIRKGTFPRLLDATQRAVWPFEEKLGARPTGRWKVFYPDANSRTEESPDYDEMITMTRYASYSHYQAMQPGRTALHGGNGPDWRAWRDAVDEVAEQTLSADTRVEFLEGLLHHSPPYFMPAVAERYRLSGN